MNYTQILKRAWQIVWRYPALWIFGVLLAFGGSSSMPNGGQRFFSFDSSDFAGRDFPFRMPESFQWRLEEFNRLMDQGGLAFTRSEFFIWFIAFLIFIFLLIVLSVVLKYIGLTANIRMVDHLETSGEKVSWKQGFRWGWSGRAVKLWLINLTLIVPMLIAVLVLFGCAALPVLLGIASGGDATTAGIVATVGLGLLVFLVVFLIGAVIGLLLNFARRVCVIEDQGVFASIRAGWQLMRTYWKDVLIMWLILIGVRIGVGIALIPVTLLVLAIAAVIGGGVALLIYTISAQAVILTVIVGLLFFFLIMFLPLLFVSGLVETYFESAWTLIYRETRTPAAAEELPLEPEPASAA